MGGHAEARTVRPNPRRGRVRTGDAEASHDASPRGPAARRGRRAPQPPSARRHRPGRTGHRGRRFAAEQRRAPATAWATATAPAGPPSIRSCGPGRRRGPRRRPPPGRRGASPRPWRRRRAPGPSPARPGLPPGAGAMPRLSAGSTTSPPNRVSIACRHPLLPGVRSPRALATSRSSGLAGLPSRSPRGVNVGRENGPTVAPAAAIPAATTPSTPTGRPPAPGNRASARPRRTRR